MYRLRRLCVGSEMQNDGLSAFGIVCVLMCAVVAARKQNENTRPNDNEMYLSMYMYMQIFLFSKRVMTQNKKKNLINFCR